MILKQYLTTNSLFSNTIANDVKTFYGLDSAPAWLADKYLNQYTQLLKLKEGSREMYVEDEEDVQLILKLMFITNHDKYDHLYKLFALEYNPIWNVDGVTVTERVGSEDRATSDTASDTTKYNTTDSTTGTNTTTFNTNDSTTGTDTTTYNLTEGHTETDSKTTYDSGTFYDTDKKVSSDTKTGTESVGLNESRAKTGTEALGLNESHAKTGTEKLDRSASGTEGIDREETETVTRQGNQGVTTTQSMAREEIEYSELIKLIEIIALDITREITYSC